MLKGKSSGSSLFHVDCEAQFHGYESSEILEARSWREAIRRFCDKRNISQDEDLVGLRAIDDSGQVHYVHPLDDGEKRNL